MRKYNISVFNHVSAYTVALLLVLPNMIWILMDKGLWRGDPVGYALASINLYRQMATNLAVWKGYAFHGYKGPLILWLGEFFVPLGNIIGSINFSLLLIPLIATYITLFLLFRSFELLFHNKAIAFCGCLVVASSPLFACFSTGFWVEPMQIAITCWFIYALVKAGSWSFYFSLSQFIIAFSLAMLIKLSSPIYIIGPSIAFWVIVLRGKPSMKMNKKDIFLFLISMLFFLPAAVFYVVNLKDLLGFAHFAATNSLFGSETSKFDLLIQNISDGVFMDPSYFLLASLLLWGLIKTFRLRAYSNFDIVFIVALFQLALFSLAWLGSSNVDSRYFLPTLPYFALFVCWSLAVINNRILTAVSLCLFLFQFVQVDGTALGLIYMHLPVPIRSLTIKYDKDIRILDDIMPLAKRDSAIIFDLDPELGVAEFQYELAKEDITGNWLHSCIDVTSFFHFHRQEIDTEKINVETAWKDIVMCRPDFYITWQNRLSASLAETEIKKIDRYNAATVPTRWAIADKMKNSAGYEVIKSVPYPDLLIYKRRDIPLAKLCKIHLIQTANDTL